MLLTCRCACRCRCSVSVSLCAWVSVPCLRGKQYLQTCMHAYLCTLMPIPCECIPKHVLIHTRTCTCMDACTKRNLDFFEQTHTGSAQINAPAPLSRAQPPPTLSPLTHTHTGAGVAKSRADASNGAAGTRHSQAGSCRPPAGGSAHVAGAECAASPRSLCRPRRSHPKQRPNTKPYTLHSAPSLCCPRRSFNLAKTWRVYAVICMQAHTAMCTSPSRPLARVRR